MEGAGFIRAHSEKVELKFNIFAEDNEAKGGEEGGEENPNENQEEEGDQSQVFVDEQGNPVNLADLDLGDLGDIANLAELGDLDNLEGIDDTLRE
jgi:hypothetical protein